MGVVLLRRHVLRADMPHNPILLPRQLQGWFASETGPWRLVSSAVAALVFLVIILLPFSLDVPGLVGKMVGTAGGYPWLSVNAYNPWALFGADGSAPLAFGGGWSSDTAGLFGPLPGVVIGVLLLALAFLLGALRLLWLSDRRSIVIVTIFFALAFFILPTRVHERYMFPIFGLLPILAVVDRRWMAATIVLSIGAFINMHGVLTTDLYATPNLQDMPLGDLFRDPAGIVAAIALEVAGFAFVAWRLRPAAAFEPDPYADVAEDADADLEYEPAYLPEEPARPWYAGLSSLVPSYSFRRDRSALLAGEGGGRLDRRDLVLLLVVFGLALGSRTYRLEQPFSMHFDEVYHARTAMEFLQDWRYGIPHSIYEFTHPHLAKYSMAVGIELLGNNQVVSSEDLGVDVRAAAIEERWSPADAPSEHAGDRLYVATSDGVRVYDLEQQDRPLLATIAGDYSSLAVDPDGHVLYLGQADGTVNQLSTADLDALDRSSPASAEALEAAPFTVLHDLTGELDRLEVIGGQLIGGSTGGSLVSLDPFTAEITGRSDLPQINGLSRAPARSEVIVDPAQVDDVQALAASLATLLDDDAVRIADAINQAQGAVPIAAYIGDKADAVNSAIDDGTLTGVSVNDGDAVAVATDAGVTLLDASTLALLDSVASTQPVSGLAFAERGPDPPTLYAAAGDKLLTIRLAQDQPVVQGDTLSMPNAVTDVYWNPSTTMIHALGRTQDGSGWTVYVIEPRGNSVFADAKLGFEPQSVVLDAQQQRPAEDRADLLALSPTGQLETVDIGNNQFAYRFPGVLAGALTAALIFLLARFLFRRRSVAVIVAMLVLLDGMFFANSRIAMNDTYVAFFSIAAFTVFAPLWLGRWKSGWATAGGLFAVGILLGLALASKWVGAYAIGGIGLLILLRSALGRWIALAAMIGMTGVLGYPRHRRQPRHRGSAAQLSVPPADDRADRPDGGWHGAAASARHGRGAATGRGSACAGRHRGARLWRLPDADRRGSRCAAASTANRPGRRCAALRRGSGRNWQVPRRSRTWPLGARAAT